MSVRARWLLAGLIVATAAVIALWPRQNDAPAPASGPPSPDLTAARAAAGLMPCAGSGTGPSVLSGVRLACLGDGSTVDVGAALGGRAVLVNVWATWCEPCREELPVLAAYAASPGAVSVVGIAVQSPPADALNLLARLGVRYANIADPDRAAMRALKVPDALPASYVIESGGSVHFVSDPRLFRSVESVREAVARYLPPDGSGRP